jgi:3-oxoacyl-[acyl-carrier protein] reductase
MIERNFGRIANVSSVAGKEGNPNAAAYSTAMNRAGFAGGSNS